MARVNVLGSEDVVERGESLTRYGCEGAGDGANDVRSIIVD